MDDEAVVKGKRPMISLSVPASDDYMQLMISCWDQDSADRPAADQIVHGLKRLLQLEDEKSLDVEYEEWK